MNKNAYSATHYAGGALIGGAIGALSGAERKPGETRKEKRKRMLRRAVGGAAIGAGGVGIAHAHKLKGRLDQEASRNNALTEHNKSLHTRNESLAKENTTLIKDKLGDGKTLTGKEPQPKKSRMSLPIVKEPQPKPDTFNAASEIKQHRRVGGTIRRAAGSITRGAKRLANAHVVI